MKRPNNRIEHYGDPAAGTPRLMRDVISIEWIDRNRDRRDDGS